MEMTQLYLLNQSMGQTIRINIMPAHAHVRNQADELIVSIICVCQLSLATLRLCSFHPSQTANMLIAENLSGTEQAT